MAKGSNQKLKLLYLSKIFQELTDEEHGITLKEIVAELERYGIAAERKSLYNDVNELIDFGMDIVKEKSGRTCYYKLVSRTFELPELKLLVDSVQASKFITEKKTQELIKKIENCASCREANMLQRQVYILGRVKTTNENIYYNVDLIHTAISENRKIRFQYFQWDINKQKILRKEGEFYCISPWALTWDDENYYMIGFDGEANKIKHYRVDKMLNMELTKDKRQGRELFESFNVADYAKKVFGMFDGDVETVKLKVVNEMAGVIIDRFGKDVSLRPIDDTHFTVNVDVAISEQFFGWVISLGDGVEIVTPERVVDRMRDVARRIGERYL